ncbi:MAG: outer membrane protein assembly factor BamB [Betaproteobacteria bacterium RIFCSPLOWO2_02_FULL_63_19]|nr:MAG: outer membrane protein assembly factor BamB [Betaproteobacteria bacterium RIFCSPLOWO2_02_FULL_63_19]
MGVAPRFSCLIVAALMLAGCSSLNPLNWFGGSDKRPKMAALPALSGAIPVRMLWQASIGAAGTAIFSPAVANESVYAAAQDGTVVRLQAGTGKQVWRASAAGILSGGVGADNSLVVVGTGQGEVIALDAADGRLRWRARVSSEVLSPPVLTGDLVVVRSADSRLFAFDTRDGGRRWVYQRSTPTLSVRSPEGIVAARGLVFAGFPGGKLVAVALTNGALRWEATVSLPRGTTELERVTDVVGMPWISEREVCAVAYQGRVACFDATTGNLLWARPMSSTAGLDSDARYVFVPDEKGAVHALDRAGGTSVWTQDKLALRALTAPLALGREVVVGDIEGYVHILSRENGSFIGRTATDGGPIESAPVRIDGGFLVQTAKGGLYALSTR